MARFLIDPDQRTCVEVGADYEFASTSAVLADAGSFFFAQQVDDTSAWMVLENLIPQPIQGVVLADVELTRAELVEAVDFGTVQQVGTLRMFRGERLRRSVI